MLRLGSLPKTGHLNRLPRFQRKKNGRRPIVVPEKVVEMLESGMSHKEIAATLGVSERTTYRREIMAHYMACPTCNGTGRILKKGKSA